MVDTYNLQPVDIVSAVIGATEFMKKNLHKYLQLIPENVTSLELQIKCARETFSVLKGAFGCRLVTYVRNMGQVNKTIYIEPALGGGGCTLI